MVHNASRRVKSREAEEVHRAPDSLCFAAGRGPEPSRVSSSSGCTTARVRDGRTRSSCTCPGSTVSRARRLARTEGTRAMLDSVHMLAGAAIGRALQRPYLALPVAFASHFVLDSVPHFSHESLAGQSASQAVLGVADVAVGVILVLWLSAGRSRRLLIVSCAFAAMAMDLFDHVPGLQSPLHWLPLGDELTRLHHGLQDDVSSGDWPLGLATQLWTVAMAVGVLAWPCKRQGGQGQAVANDRRAAGRLQRFTRSRSQRYPVAETRIRKPRRAPVGREDRDARG